MTITAKYAARCAACSAAITPGQRIEWAKGSPVRHTTCASLPAARSTMRPSSLRGRRTGCRCGSVEGTIRDTDCWTCRHDAE